MNIHLPKYPIIIKHTFKLRKINENDNLLALSHAYVKFLQVATDFNENILMPPAIKNQL